MKTQQQSTRRWPSPEKRAEIRSRKRTIFGFTIIGIGIWWLLQRMGLIDLPPLYYSWPVIVMGVGIIQILANRFQRTGGYITFAVGGFFFMKKSGWIPPEFIIYFWPILLIVVGILILSRRGRFSTSSGRDFKSVVTADLGDTEIDSNDIIDSVVILGGTKKEVVSKNFRGGEVTCVLGGAELQLGNADIQHETTLEITVVMGGVKLLVPSHWNVVINTTNILGGVDDKRRFNTTQSIDESKTLVIAGTTVMGGIDIQSY